MHNIFDSVRISQRLVTDAEEVKLNVQNLAISWNKRLRFLMEIVVIIYNNATSNINNKN